MFDETQIKILNSTMMLIMEKGYTATTTKDIAKKAGARVVGTGRSDFPNQINNVLVFPGIFRGALDCGATAITENMKLAAAKAIASHIPENELNE